MVLYTLHECVTDWRRNHKGNQIIPQIFKNSLFMLTFYMPCEVSFYQVRPQAHLAQDSLNYVYGRGSHGSLEAAPGNIRD